MSETPLIFIAGVVIGLTLGPLSARLTLPTAQRAGLLFAVIFVLNSLINVIEALFFTTIPAAEHLYSLVTSAIGHAGLAVLLALLFRPAAVERGLPTALRETLSRRRWSSWAWRLGLALGVGIGGFFISGNQSARPAKAKFDITVLSRTRRILRFALCFALPGP